MWRTSRQRTILLSSPMNSIASLEPSTEPKSIRSPPFVWTRHCFLSPLR
ncbi:MAG: hypothetical protein KF782_23055 [Labilithrix sp.]|nr:hypothetical protein [Labilithrix sp.]